MRSLPDILPTRAPRPRTTGLTHVIDTGLSPRQAEDFVQVAGAHVDIVKLGWGTSLVSGALREKVDVYRAAGIPVVLGGSLLEAAVLAGAVDSYVDFVRGMSLTHIEVSDGTIDMPRADKLDLIRTLAGEFTVLSEVGSKDSSVDLPADTWVTFIQEELAAGSWKVVTEARESGTVGIFDASGDVRSTVIDAVTTAVDPAMLLFEAPKKAQQVWFLKRFGPNVNLGNIAPAEVISLETLRLGLRGDTMLLAREWFAHAEAMR